MNEIKKNLLYIGIFLGITLIITLLFIGFFNLHVEFDGFLLWWEFISIGMLVVFGIDY